MLTRMPWSTYHLLITKFSHSDVSCWLSARFLCKSSSYCLRKRSVSDSTLLFHTANVRKTTIKIQKNENWYSPRSQEVTSAATTNRYTRSCSFSRLRSCRLSSMNKTSLLLLSLLIVDITAFKKSRSLSAAPAFSPNESTYKKKKIN